MRLKIWFLRFNINHQRCDQLVKFNMWNLIWIEQILVIKLSSSSIKKWGIPLDVVQTISTISKAFQLTNSLQVVQENGHFYYKREFWTDKRLKFCRSCPLWPTAISTSVVSQQRVTKTHFWLRITHILTDVFLHIFLHSWNRHSKCN